MNEIERTCDFGGMYWYPTISGPAVYQERCTEAPTHRYRSAGMAEGFWGMRCGRHAACLDATRCTIEERP